jgi:hypothetical protein
LTIGVIKTVIKKVKPSLVRTGIPVPEPSDIIGPWEAKPNTRAKTTMNELSQVVNKN